MKNWKKLISAGLALGLVLTSVPQSTSVVKWHLTKCYFRAGAGSSAECTDYSTEGEWTF